MTEKEKHEGPTQLDRLRGWLMSDVSVTLPGWAFAAAGVIALLLLAVALD